MVERSFDQLVTDLGTRRKDGEPPVLLLGAGASAAAGIPTLDALIEFLGYKDHREKFYEYIQSESPDGVYRQLARYLQTQPQTAITPGYQALATLCAEKCFDLVLTTNMDPLLDDALSAARLWRRDYLLIVNGMVRLIDRLTPLLKAARPRVKVVKLHGDLFERVMAWTKAEMDTYLTEIWPYLQPAVANRDFLIVGYSMSDERVRDLVESSGGSVWFTSRSAIPDHLRDNTTMRFVVDSRCAFEELFPELVKALLPATPRGVLDPTIIGGLSTSPLGSTVLELLPDELGHAVEQTPTALTMDDATAATLAVKGPKEITATAFLLAEPRVIICDRYSSDANRVGDTVHLVDSIGNEFSANIIASNENYPFGPTVLEAPAELRVPGLRLNPDPLLVDDEVQILVAAGTKTGVSSGKVTATGISSTIAPIDGDVGDLVELESFVAPGSSGAPVVDASLSVLAFIVAGAEPHTPRAFAYPAQSWAPMLDGLRQDS